MRGQGEPVRRGGIGSIGYCMGDQPGPS
jgi:hypothetical protein